MCYVVLSEDYTFVDKSLCIVYRVQVEVTSEHTLYNCEVISDHAHIVKWCTLLNLYKGHTTFE